MNVGNPYMSRCGTVFIDDEETKLIERIAKLRRLGEGFANFNESMSALNKAAELERKLQELRAERERANLDEILLGVEAIAKRHYAIADALADVINKCRIRHSTKGLDDMVAYVFNAQGIDPRFGGAGGLPAGKHPVTITKTEAKSTRDNQGGYVALTCTAFDGAAKGGSMDIRLNLHNKSQDAVRIANSQLAAICAVTGVFQFQDTDELKDKPFIIEVAPQKDNPQYSEVIAVYDMDGNEPGKAGSGPMQGGATNNGGFPQNNGGNAGGFGQNAGNGFANGQQGGQGDPNAGQGQQGQQGQQGGGAWGQNGGNQGQNGGQQGGGAGWGQNAGGGAPQNQGGNQGGGTGWAQGGQNAGAASGGTPGWGQR